MRKKQEYDKYKTAIKCYWSESLVLVNFNKFWCSTCKENRNINCKLSMNDLERRKAELKELNFEK